MLCISAAYTVARCPSVTFVYFVETNTHIFKFFSPSSSHTILVFFRTKRYGSISTGTILTGASNPAEGRQKLRFSSISGFIACCQRCDRQVLHTQLRWTVVGDTHRWYSGVVCCLRETIDQVYMTRRLNVTPKTTEHNFIARSGKSEAAKTNNKILRSRYCIVEQRSIKHRAASRNVGAAENGAKRARNGVIGSGRDRKQWRWARSGERGSQKWVRALSGYFPLTLRSNGLHTFSHSLVAVHLVSDNTAFNVTAEISNALYLNYCSQDYEPADKVYAIEQHEPH